MKRFVAFVMFVGFVGFVTSAQEASEASLEIASASRTVRLRSGASGRVVDVPIEVYVARVLAGEGEARAPDAAQRALAITIRTFAAANMGRHQRDGFDLCDTTHCQVLRPSTPASRASTLATAGRLLTYEGRPAEVFYSASCGGRSEAASEVWSAADLPYLRSRSDDVHDGEDPWVLEVQLRQVERALRDMGFEGRRLTDVRIERRSGSGRVTRVRLSGMRPDEIAGDDFRAAIGVRALRSTAFEMTREGEVLRFSGRGYGHGVGLCVVGAGRRAGRGETTEQILEHYYPGLQLQSLASAALTVPSEPAPEHVVARATTAQELIARRARDEIAAALGIRDAPMPVIEAYESLETYRQATGRPWWMETAVDGTSIALAPAAILAQHEGQEAAIRRAVAEMLVKGAFSDRPVWVGVGAARYYASSQRRVISTKRLSCPTDAELTMAVSAAAYREAELRAEACFVRALAKAGEWRSVR